MASIASAASVAFALAMGRLAISGGFSCSRPRSSNIFFSYFKTALVGIGYVS